MRFALLVRFAWAASAAAIDFDASNSFAAGPRPTGPSYTPPPCPLGGQGNCQSYANNDPACTDKCQYRPAGFCSCDRGSHMEICGAGYPMCVWGAYENCFDCSAAMGGCNATGLCPAPPTNICNGSSTSLAIVECDAWTDLFDATNGEKTGAAYIKLRSLLTCLRSITPCPFPSRRQVVEILQQQPAGPMRVSARLSRSSGPRSALTSPAVPRPGRRCRNDDGPLVTCSDDGHITAL
jgi:hypothetical protein